MSERTWSKPLTTPGSVKVSLVDPDTDETVASTQKTLCDPSASGITALELALNLMGAPFAWMTIGAAGRRPLTIPVMDPSFPDAKAENVNPQATAVRFWKAVHDIDAAVELHANGMRRIVVAKASADTNEVQATSCNDLDGGLPVVSASEAKKKKGATRHEF